MYRWLHSFPQLNDDEQEKTKIRAKIKTKHKLYGEFDPGSG